jgi:hypothetical protein
MLKLEKKQYWVIGLITAILSFVLLFVGIKVISASLVSIQNIMAYIIFSALLGIVASALIFFRFKIAFLSFIAGLLLGYIFMYKAFLFDMTGWGDLIGVLSLLILTISGLGVGLLVQLGYYLYNKYKKQ